MMESDRHGAPSETILQTTVSNRKKMGEGLKKRMRRKKRRRRKKASQKDPEVRGQGRGCVDVEGGRIWVFVVVNIHW